MFWISAFCVSFVGSIVPGFATELFVVAGAAVVAPAAVVPFILLTAAGQVLGKLVIYGTAGGRLMAGRGAGSELQRARCAVQRAARFVPALVFVSALASVPPYYLASIACGALRTGIVPFAVAGFAGRSLRTCALVWLPRLIVEAVR